MAKAISHEELLTVLNYDQNTGEFAWRDTLPNFSKYKAEVGHIDTRGRRYINIKRKSYAAHQLAVFYVTGQWPQRYVAPLNGNYLDLRYENLREISSQETARTRKARANASSGSTGVSWDSSRSRWVAYITINYKRRHLGYFKNKEDAAAAYESANAARDVGSGVTPEMMAKKREVGRRNARYLALWNRVNRQYGQTAWAGVNEFIADIGMDLHDRQSIVPVDDTKPVGPKNWKWELSLFYRFDRSTPDGRNAYEQAVRDRGGMWRRSQEFVNKFGITLEDYHKLHDAQGGACATCGRPETERRNGKIKWLAVDHCHSTGKIRGLLCAACNVGLGRFRDDPAILRAAAEYLERHAAVQPDGSASNKLSDEGARR